MRKILLAVAVLATGLANAQINYGGEPITWERPELGAEAVEFYSTPSIDLELAQAQDEVTDQYKETPYRFGIEHEVDINFFDEARAQDIKGDRQVWRMGIECPGAISVNFLLDQFYIPEGGELFVYSEDKVDLHGAFTHESNKESGIFPISIVKGDRIIMEYIEPVSGELASLHISQIVHGYRPVANKWAERGPYGNSGACNINANCPEGLPWEAQKRSVALILSGGFAACSGAMVNNTLQDETPYFLTANHCLGNPNNWVYVFNHETEGCTGNTGPTNQTVSGGTLRASSAGSDMALVELSNNVPAAYNVYFAGWDNSDSESAVTSAVGIHHPSGDLKKICFEDDAPYHNTAAGAAVWYIDQWEDGVTEPGSSGSPLFDQNGRIIGQLYGGAAACSGSVNNGQFDYYGRVGVSWNGSSSSNRLVDWLDPNSSGAVTLDGYGPNDVTYPNDVASQGISNVPDLLCDLAAFSPNFTLRNAGSNTLTSATIEYSYNGVAQMDINWTGSLAQGETESIALAEMTPSAGTNTIEVSVSNPNGGADDNSVNNNAVSTLESAAQGVQLFDITITTDDYASETTWEVTNQGGGVIASGGDSYENNTTYEEEVMLPGDGCYTFTLFDSFGDGICCAYGEGSYSVVDGDGTTLLSGGEFGNEDGGTFAMSQTTSLEDLSTAQFSVYPNPASDVLNIGLAEDMGNYQIEVLNGLGQVVMTRAYAGDMNINLDLNGLAGGSYMIRLSNESMLGLQRFTIK